jgi:asparagine synthase (glutamine-hydrolysing)
MGPAPTEVERLRGLLDEALDASLRPLRSLPRPLGILFSGGVDSSLLAWELRNEPGVALYTLGSEGSHDLTAGREGAKRLGLPWQPLRVGGHELRAAETRCSEELSGLPPVIRTVLLALAVAIEEAPALELVLGQGADELFLGYAHYRNRPAEEVERRSREDLARLHGTDWPRTQRIAQRYGKEVSAPYLTPTFEASAQEVPIALRLPRDDPKRFFREWAVARGLPRELADRAKKAVQYGSGVDALVRSWAKRPH